MGDGNPSQAKARVLREIAEVIAKLKVDPGSQSARDKAVARLKEIAGLLEKAGAVTLAPTPSAQAQAVRQEE